MTRHRDLTLVELVVVLLLLAVVSSVALRSTESVVQQGRYDATVRQLQALETSVRSPSGAVDAEGRLTISGFTSDLGRPPRLIGADPETQLQELWDGTGLLPYDYYPSTEDAEVALGFGWRGPYLRFPIGTSAQRLTDGWGRALRLQTTTYELSQIYSGQIVAGQEVALSLVESAGADGLHDQGLGFDTQLQAPLAVQVTLNFTVTGGNGMDPVLVVVYEPDLDPALPPTAVAPHAIKILPSTDPTPHYQGFVGRKAIRAYQSATLDKTTPNLHLIATKSAIRYVSITQSDTINLELP